MPQSIFVSYVYEDKRHRDNVAGWFAKQAVGPNRVMIAEALDRRQQGENAIKDYLRPLIRGRPPSSAWSVTTPTTATG
ncbi:MAG: hypothetical protein IPK80_27630 [Nannocystis sp.]|nr:hypothetical protein [Nannocystis sp.]